MTTTPVPGHALYFEMKDTESAGRTALYLIVAESSNGTEVTPFSMFSKVTSETNPRLPWAKYKKVDSELPMEVDYDGLLPREEDLQEAFGHALNLYEEIGGVLEAAAVSYWKMYMEPFVVEVSPEESGEILNSVVPVSLLERIGRVRTAKRWVALPNGGVN